MLKINQIDYKTHQLYNARITKLIGLGHKVYVTAFVPFGSFDLNYKVHVSLLDVLIFRWTTYPIFTIKFKLGQTQPKSYWGQVEVKAMQRIKADTFLQTLNRYFESKS